MSAFVPLLSTDFSNHCSVVMSCVTKELSVRLFYTYRNLNSNVNTILSTHSITKPFTPVLNDNLDNEMSELIVCEGDVIGSYTSKEGRKYSMRPLRVSRYKIVEIIGKGTFGNVFKCKEMETGKLYAMKIIKNRKAYFRQGLLEISMLTIMNNFYDNKRKRIEHMHDHFLYCDHLCIVFELLEFVVEYIVINECRNNLYQIITQHRENGMQLATIKKFIYQLLKGVKLMSKAGIIHGDLKPENVGVTLNTLKIIDLGSACFQNYTLHTYIQSRHYRAPEIVLEHQYNSAIDMWSIGCMVAEIFLGIPLFAANCEYDLIYRYVKTLGMLPNDMIIHSNKRRTYFKKYVDSTNNTCFRLKERFEFEWENRCVLPPHTNYLPYQTLHDIIFNCDLCVRTPMDHRTKKYLYHFLSNCFSYDPKNRLTPQQALSHPFITGRYHVFSKPLDKDIQYQIYGHSVTSSPNEMVADAFSNHSLDSLKQLALSRRQYYDIFMKLLHVGHIANVTIDSPFKYGSITPLQLKKVFKCDVFIEQNRGLVNKTVPRKVSIQQIHQEIKQYEEKNKEGYDLIVGKLDDKQRQNELEDITHPNEVSRRRVLKIHKRKRNKKSEVISEHGSESQTSEGSPIRTSIKFESSEENKENHNENKDRTPQKMNKEKKYERSKSCGDKKKDLCSEGRDLRHQEKEDLIG
ncbi:Protein kinase [Entamoeba marina]